MRLFEFDERAERQEAVSIASKQMLADIQANCKPFLRDIGFPHNGDAWLYRGMQEYPSARPLDRVIAPWPVRKDRRPLDTHPNSHAVVDDWFNDNFGWRARSQGLFGVASKNIAASYGELCVLFPIGEYEYLWSDDVVDMSDNIAEVQTAVFHKAGSVKRTDATNAAIAAGLVEMLNTCHWHKSTGLRGLLMDHSKREILFRCDAYYAVPILAHSSLNIQTLMSLINPENV